MSHDLRDVVRRDMPPEPWAEGDNIPWDDPDFSQRMLREHLSQDHDLASRRTETIDEQVAWIHTTILSSKPSRILDLGCGPGLYTSRFAKRGHTCVGIDFSPSSIEHAVAQASDHDLSCSYVLADVRDSEIGVGFDLVMMLFGQINVFRRDEARHILAKAHRALVPGGRLLLEPQRHETVRAAGLAPPAWYSAPAGEGLFSDDSHLVLSEGCWDEASQSSTQRFFVIDAATCALERHAMTTQAYTNAELVDLVAGSGFVSVQTCPSLVGVEADDVSQAANLVVIGSKSGSTR